MNEWPIKRQISGPVVMIGLGTIGRGTLPLVQRHFDYDPSRFVVIDPDDASRSLLDARGVRFLQKAVTPDNYRELLTPLLTEGEGQGFCVNLSVDVSSLDMIRDILDEPLLKEAGEHSATTIHETERRKVVFLYDC